MRNLELVMSGISDPVVRENFERIVSASRSGESILTNFVGRFIEVVVPAAVTAFGYPHGLPFKPSDILLTSALGAGALTFIYASFTRTDIVFTTTGAVTFRCFVGSYQD